MENNISQILQYFFWSKIIIISMTETHNYSAFQGNSGLILQLFLFTLCFMLIVSLITIIETTAIRMNKLNAKIFGSISGSGSAFLPK